MPPALFRTALISVFSVLGAASCKGSLGAEAKMEAELDPSDQTPVTSDEAAVAESEERSDGEATIDRALPKSGSGTSQGLVPGEAPLPEGTPLYGARHDVTVRSTKGAIACRCVSVLIGPTTMTQVQWQGAIPLTKPEEQLFVALAPDSECPGVPAGSQGGSYWGYRVSGKDVIVLLESWQPEGKKTPPPRTIAAIIPRPPVEGQVYVAPVDPKLPYGASADGSEARCALGNPGPARTTPFPSPAGG